MPSRHDAVLLIAFGGPTRPEDVRPFLANVLRGRPIPPDRLEEVFHHYELIGGRSPLTDITFRQAHALENELRARRLSLPVYVGMRNWHPYLRETLDQMGAVGVRRALGIVLAPQQTDASWERYQRDVAEARAAVGRHAPEVDYAPGWHDHPLFIEAMATRVAEALATLPPERREAAPLVCTAHSVPVVMAASSPYVSQVTESARLVAEWLGHSPWSVAYQSRSGRPEDPWLEPDISDALRGLAARGASDVVVVPVGFVCDHVEVLYDLDVEARQTAAEAGLHFIRAGTVNDHFLFARMLADLTEEAA